jgi:hypothetical protein
VQLRVVSIHSVIEQKKVTQEQQCVGELENQAMKMGTRGTCERLGAGVNAFHPPWMPSDIAVASAWSLA